MNIHLPKLLQKGEPKRLNDHIYNKTYCFAFFQPDQTVFATEPASWQDAFSIAVVGLYSVYHDMGCGFLKILLNSCHCPPTLPTGEFHKNHIRKVAQLRAGIAHGVLYGIDRNTAKKELAYYAGKESDDSETLTAYINSLDAHQWEHAYQKLIIESDALHDYLVSWADEWGKDASGCNRLPGDFCNDWGFVNSINVRVCKPLLAAVGVTGGAIDGTCKSHLQTWKTKLKADYQSKPKTAEELYAQLGNLIAETLAPPTAQTSSSADVATRYGFGVPS